MNETGKQILKVLDRALGGPEPTKPKPTSNKFTGPRVNLTPLAMSTVAGCVKGDFASNAEVAEVKAAGKRWQKAMAIELSHLPDHAKATHEKQGFDLAAMIAADGKIMALGDIQSREDFDSDFLAIRTAAKLARRNITAEVVPVVARIFGRYASAIQVRLEALEKLEKGQAEALGLNWSPSGDYMITDAVGRWATRNSDAANFAHVDVNPVDLLNGTPVKL